MEGGRAQQATGTQILEDGADGTKSRKKLPVTKAGVNVSLLAKQRGGSSGAARERVRLPQQVQKLEVEMRQVEQHLQRLSVENLLAGERERVLDLVSGYKPRRGCNQPHCTHCTPPCATGV
jgi:hypothetical protein